MELESNTDFAHFHVLRKLDLEGEVYKAFDKKNERFVTVRLLFPRPALKEHIEELQHSLLMQHPSAMRIYETGNVQGHPYLATELPTGLSLKSRLSQKKVPFYFAIEILRQIMECIEFGTKNNVNQRELRPTNIYLGISAKYDLQLKIVALDLDKVSSESHISVSSDFGSILKYIAPEVIQQGSPRENSVIFSAGVIAYQLFSDQDPFEADTSSQMYAVLQKELPPIQTLKPEYDEQINSLLSKMLHKDPEVRFGASQVLNFIEKEILKGKKICVKLIPNVYLDIMDNGKPRNVPLKLYQKNAVTLGRSDRCDVKLDNVKASRFHAKIECVSDDDFLVMDTNSRNGIKVNGVKVPSRLLKDKDEIDISRISKITFRRSPQEFVYLSGDASEGNKFEMALKSFKDASVPEFPAAPISHQEESDYTGDSDPTLQTLEMNGADLRTISEESYDGPELTISAKIEFNWGYLPEKLQIEDSNTLRENLSSLLENLVRSASADRGILISYNNEILQCEIIRKRDKTEARLDELFNIKEDLIHKVFETGLPVLSNFSPTAPPLSLLIFPIAWQRTTHAVLYLDNVESKKGLTEQEVSQIELMSFYIGSLLEKSTLDQKLGEAKKEIAKLQGPKETFQLQENQLTWFPASIPVHKEIEIDGERLIYETQEKTFYDFIYDSDEEPLFVLLGKQHGNLVYAGVLRLIFRTIIHSMADFPSLFSLVNCLNEAILKEIGANSQISLLLFRWDPLNTVLNYLGCGNHEFACLREGESKAELRKIEAPYLGSQNLGSALHQETIELKSNDTLIWFGEDLTSVKNQNGEAFGSERLLETINQNSDKDARSIKGALLNSVIEHIDEETPATDIVIGTIRRK